MDVFNNFSSYNPSFNLPQTGPAITATTTATTGRVSFQELLQQRQPDKFIPLPQPAAATPQQAAAELENVFPPVQHYTVQRGDTLSDIVANQLRRQGAGHSRSELYGLVGTVASDNNLTNPDRIFPGQHLDTTSVPRFVSSRATGTPTVFAAAPPEKPDFLSPTDKIDQPAIFIPAGNSDQLQAPAMGRISSSFGTRLHPLNGGAQLHDGLDIVLANGTPINPVAPGTVTFAGENGGYGLTVDIDHGDGLSSRYAHLSRLLVRSGDEVASDQIIGRSGETGLSNGPHLHLEIHRDQQAVDPLTLLDRADIERGPQQADGSRPGDSVNGIYTVRPGDTLSTIAAREMQRMGLEYTRQDLYHTVQQLAAANGIRNPDRIIPGQNLNLSSLEAGANPRA